ncbi:flavodoxin domain-containing protein [Amphritea sp. 2_MG-2023]|jgi:flavodoxin|uniref:flavodoxin domain-containing protein n=1 Tax=Amphritea TaxID=515417 RepID=UPI001C06C584|nr:MULTISPECIES: flavodoxin domain-containing protein [Amphritea]MBU2967458.1 flavodoxin domain-containing protein [Amphritea atlantica]MDO6418287.1 flavodoxin domain-containing protein [Amphritea sp. 2_MG-2023]
MAEIRVVVGSTYGNASLIADDCTDQLKRLGHQATLLNEPTYEQVTNNPDVILICTATIGQGEVPVNLQPLYDDLSSRKPDFSAVRFGLIALGDSSYETFAEGGKQMNELMHDLGAKSVGQALFIDSCETPDPDEAAASWIDQWSKKL